jgi:hypothetical protein
MNIEPPVIFHTYVSGTDASLIVYVVAVNVFEASDADDILFSVECCDPAYKDDAWHADGFEMTSDIWARHHFTLVSNNS